MELNLPPRFKYVAELPGEIRLFNFLPFQLLIAGKSQFCP